MSLKIALIVAIVEAIIATAALTVGRDMWRYGFIRTVDTTAKQQAQDTVDTVSSKNNAVKLTEYCWPSAGKKYWVSTQ